jgi:hypothetical protein
MIGIEKKINVQTAKVFSSFICKNIKQKLNKQ